MPEPQCLALAPALVPTCASEVTYPVALADGASTAGYLDRLVKGYLDTYTPHLNLTLHAPCVDAMRRLACRVYFPSCEGVGRGQGLVCTDACDELQTLNCPGHMDLRCRPRACGAVCTFWPSNCPDKGTERLGAPCDPCESLTVPPLPEPKSIPPSPRPRLSWPQSTPLDDEVSQPPDAAMKPPPPTPSRGTAPYEERLSPEHSRRLACTLFATWDELTDARRGGHQQEQEGLDLAGRYAAVVEGMGHDRPKPAAVVGTWMSQRAQIRDECARLYYARARRATRGLAPARELVP